MRVKLAVIALARLVTSSSAAALTRKRIEEAFGWIKTVAGLRRTKLRGLGRVDWSSTFAAAAYNLIRLPKLLGAAA